MIPQEIRNSTILTGNDLGTLGNVEQLPTEDEISDFIAQHEDLRTNLATASEETVHKLAKEYLDKKNVDNAWRVLLAKR